MRNVFSIPFLRGRESERGVMAAEFALLLPLFVLLMALLLEGSNAIRTYSVLVEASREAARHVLLHGDAAAVPAVVQAVTADLSGTAGSTVTQALKTVTVEVGYAYQSFHGSNGFIEALFDGPIVLRASTTMPLP
ncbi:TadE family protein [Alkalidesulfovibrio alkalitolerans DSM 16529]|uniref:TadE family protein n=1 Tax=Alkalidesulfovibrio alkalitolerans DSM 16529 TaxID=1121439 RepID=S7UC90_9BACT|nr:TadE/TadG family type IV pilus assembly protein [Alkalidesulfovibrio alkalitolerans]EPR31509.1 TadE family protein [Alkalidesulfovibrio alkalitolerans DSM 16529]